MNDCIVSVPTLCYKTPIMFRSRHFLFVCLFVLLCLIASVALAKDKEPSITLTWPKENPSIKFTFGRFKQLFALGSQNTYISDVIIENLTDKAFPHVVFTVYLTDKNNIRIGDGQLQVSDIGPRQQVKVAFQVNSVGVPTGLQLSAKKDMLTSVRTVPLKVISVPPGAKLKVDGQDAGLTPIMVKFTEGLHTLEFSKEGYATGSTPLEITPDELPGGSITFELGGLSADTIELRDGTVLLGDVMSANLTQVVVRVNGQEQTLDRNRVKKIMLVERQIVQQPLTVQPAPAPNPTPK